MPYKDHNKARESARKSSARQRAANPEIFIEYKRLWRLAFGSGDKNGKERAKQWVKDHPERSHEHKLNWVVNNIDKKRQSSRISKKKNRNKIQQYENNRRKTDPKYKILCNLRSRLYHALNGSLKADNTIKLLGCSIESFKLYIESLFQAGMSWDNYGKEEGCWEIDHIIPCALFDLSKLDHQRRCFHFSNLQPLWMPENRHKSKKVLDDQFRLL